MIKLILKIILIGAGFSFLQWYQWWSNPFDQVYFIDVGQGDASLIIKSTPCRQNWCQFIKKWGWSFYEKQIVVIDGGPDMSVLSKITAFLPWWQQKIDLAIITHPHLDHYFGIIEIQERYRISEVWVSEANSKAPLYKYLVNNVKGSIFKGISVNYYKKANFDWLELWWPVQESDNALARKNINNGSLVVLATLQNKKTVLFMGDLEREGEKQLMDYLGGLNKPPILEGQMVILKAGHHCSKTASQASFIQLIQPTIAICSVGKDNRYHHPHQETLQTFNELGIRVIRTDKQGTIQYIGTFPQ